MEANNTKKLDLDFYLSPSEVQQLATGQRVAFTFHHMGQPLEVRVSITQRREAGEGDAASQDSTNRRTA